RAECGTVGDRVAGIERDCPTVLVEAIETAGRLLLRIVHRAEPQGTLGTHGTIVQPVAGQMRLDVREVGELSALRVEALQPVLQPDEKAAAAQRHDEAGPLGRRPGATAARGRLKPMQLPAQDVDEPERRLAHHPDRALAELGAPAANMLSFDVLSAAHA